MRTVIGYDQDRRPIYRDEGPGYARRQGHGGSAMGHFSGTVVIVQPNRRKPRADAEVVAKGRRSA